MKALNKYLFLLLLLAFPFRIKAQDRETIKLKADSIASAFNSLTSEKNSEGAKLADWAFGLYQSIQDTCGMVMMKIRKCGYLDSMGEPVESISEGLAAMTLFSEKCDSIMLMECLINLSGSYLSSGDYSRVDSLCTVGLGLWNPAWIKHERKFALYNNKAIALASVGDFASADVTFRKMLVEATKHELPEIAEDALINIGSIKGFQFEWDSAYYYTNLALISAQNRNEYKALIDIKINLASIQKNRRLYPEALAILNGALRDAYEHDDKLSRAKILTSFSWIYDETGDYYSAYHNLNLLLPLKDSIMNEENIRATAEMQERFETVEKAKQIQELKVKNLDAELQTEKAKLVRNAAYAGAGFLLVAVFFLVNRYRIIRRNRNQLREKNVIIEKERSRSDHLLRNILPDEVAEELKEFGKATAKSFECATILFTDFKGFTMLAEKLTASELVAELDVCFRAFDRITSHFGMEKIKTIGDAYMAVGGVPDAAHHSPEKVIFAALEMQEFIESRLAELSKINEITFRMRVGIHSGPIVAGVVGDRKFQYDVWGDAVNTASRMESSGEVGRVNISEATFILVQDILGLKFESRGLISAKNKGDMNMYFVFKV